MMKKSILYLCGWLCFVLTSCQPDELEGLQNGTPNTLNLTIQSLQNDVKTRAVSDGDAENRLFDIYVYVFGADGNVEYQQYERVKPSEADTYTKSITGLISGDGKSVAVIANTSTNTIVTLNEERLDAIKTLDALEKEVVTLEANAIERGNNFLMSGITKNISITTDAATPVAVDLKRIDAKIRFIIKEGNNELTGKKITFTPGDWRIVSIPRQAGLFTSTEDLCASPENRFDSEWQKFETDQTYGMTFAFYLMENRAKPKSLIPATGRYSERYALREKQDKIPDPDPNRPEGSVTNGAFTYAPEGGTYVEIRGRYHHQKNDSQEESADVLYTIHLGGLDDNNQKDPNDYKSLRNTYYTYKVEIVAVNKIIAEVTSTGGENEQRPGAEGDVVIANKIITLDAYNEIRSLAFKESSIGEDMTWTVSTPYTNGPKSQEDNPDDYRWVFFRINASDVSTYSSNFRTYPGDGHVYAKGETVNLDEYIASVNRNDNTDKMLDVRQLVDLLKENKRRFGAGGNHLFKSREIHFTAFINEFYYEKNPNDPTQAVNGLWKGFVNQRTRVMNILSNLKYSPDGESSKTDAVFSIRQSSIQTMYNTESTDDYSGWGLHMIQDTEGKPFETNGGRSRESTYAYTDKNNGRQNSIQMWLPNGSKRWDSYITPADWQLTDNYNAAKYQCLRMNRDNDGDGVIDEDEIQWYLAAVNQLTDIWIGEWSYDPSARLYTKSIWNDSEEQYYVSSTVSERKREGNRWSGYYYWDNPTILWSAEGSSTGLLSGNAQVSGKDDIKRIKEAKVYYRCVRNLGLPRKESKETLPSPLITYDRETGIMSMPHLDRQSIRGYFQEDELPAHHERESANKPYWFFKVSTVTSGSNYTFQSLSDAIKASNSPCPKGWRVPNQRELALMHSRIGNDGNWAACEYYFSRTRFQFSPKRPGFVVEGGSDGLGNLRLLPNSDTENPRGGVRCVKDARLDVPEAVDRPY